MISRERRVFLVARARAESRLRLLRALGHNISWGEGPVLPEGPAVFRAPGEILIGNHCRFRGGPTVSRLITGPEGRIELGDRVGINYGAEFFAEKSIVIGEDSIFGIRVTIYDTSFHSVQEGSKTKEAPIEIGKNVWVGGNVMILPGARIGDHSVVASGAVVTSEIPPRTLAAGAPAKPIRELRASDDWRRV
jgi:acetyltransferase-like isoleucine patch superfamily enzyme